MKTKIIILSVLILTIVGGCEKNDRRDISVITFNIRYDNPRDSLNAWPNRAGIVCDFLKSQKPDLFGLQEALWYQYEAIDSALSGYSSVAVGRDDGKKKGEMNPVFYNITRFNYVSDSTFWLSETPGKPGSRGWGASLPRIVTWVKLEEKKSGKPLYYFNTHFAHDSDSARVMSAEVLLNEVRRIAGKEKFIITGDFNMLTDSRAYAILTESGKPAPLLKDSYTITESAPYGPKGTFNGWSDEPAPGRIDYIFVKRGATVKSLTTIKIKNGPVFISDHWPVKAEVVPD